MGYIQSVFNSGEAEESNSNALVGDVEQEMEVSSQRVTLGLTIIFGIVCLIAAKSNFHGFRKTFESEGFWLSIFWSLLCVIAQDGMLTTLVYGFKRWFSTFLEKSLAVTGIVVLFVTMGISSITYSMSARGLSLNSLQIAYLSWGGWFILLFVAAWALLLLLAHPIERQLRQQIRLKGKEVEVELKAKRDALKSNQVKRAKAVRTRIEATQMAARIQGSGGAAVPVTAQRNSGGYAPLAFYDNVGNKGKKG